MTSFFFGKPDSPEPAPICSPTTVCKSRRQAMRAGEMVQDRYGRWKYPINQVDAAFNQPRPIFSWPYCPFCFGPLHAPVSVEDDAN